MTGVPKEAYPNNPGASVITWTLPTATKTPSVVCMWAFPTVMKTPPVMCTWAFPMVKKTPSVNLCDVHVGASARWGIENPAKIRQRMSHSGR